MTPSGSSTSVSCWSSGSVDPTGYAEAIYRASFPETGQVPWPVLADAVTARTRWLFTLHRANRPVGIAFVHPLPERRALLEYLAVSASQQSAGLGGVLLTAVSRAMTARGRVGGLFLEVEQVAHSSAHERTVQERRLAFYDKHSCAVLAVDYLLPDLGHGQGPASHLMWKSTGMPRPSREEQNAAVLDIYQDVYGMSQQDMARHRQRTRQYL